MNNLFVTARTLGFTMALSVCSALILVGCEKEKGPLEKAGAKMDEAVNDTKRAIKDAAD